MNNKIEWSIVFAIVLLGAIILFKPASYRYEFVNIFYLALWMISILLAMVSLHGGANKKFTLFFVIVLFIMVLRTLDPFSSPVGVLSNQPDVNYHFQLLQVIDENNHLIFSDNQYTGDAKDYYGYPMLELILETFGKVTAIDLELLTKSYGYILGFPALIFVLCYYRRHLGKNEKLTMLSVLLFVSCPWFIGFTARTVALSLSFPLFILTLSMLLPNRNARLIVLLLLSFIILAHHFMGFLFIVYITTYIIARYVIRIIFNALTELKLTYKHLLITLVISFYWATMVVPRIGVYVSLFFIDMVQHVFVKPWVFEVELYSTPTAGKPTWMIVVQIIGYISFMGFGLLGFALSFLGKNFEASEPLSDDMRLDTSALLLTSTVLALPYLLGFSRAIDLVWRSLLFIFLGLAPFVAKSLILLNNLVNKSKFTRLFAKILITIALVCIIQNAVYSGVSYNYYNSAAEIQPEDVRLSLTQWVYTSRFVKQYVDLDTIYGVRIAYNIVGSLAKKNILQIAGDPVVPEGHLIEPTMLVAGEIEAGKIFILRKSLVIVPDPKNYTFSREELKMLLNHFNVVFQSQDIIMLLSMNRTGF